MFFLNYLKEEANYTLTENGAKTHESTYSKCLDLFGTIGALRYSTTEEIIARFLDAWYENPEYALKILFYARDIRGGLGERRVFRTIIQKLANDEPDIVKKNIKYIPEFGRWDDLLCFLHTQCDPYATAFIFEQFVTDLGYLHTENANKISLLGKWMPSINTSNADVVAKAKYLARSFGISERTYRKDLSALRKQIKIIENNLRNKDYSFDYSKQPSKAMFKYRKAFIRNDEKRYLKYLSDVSEGKETMHTSTLYPYDIVHKCLEAARGRNFEAFFKEERKSLDVMWNSLKDFTNGRNALAVVDGSGSMYDAYDGRTPPIDVAMSLGIYFAEHTKGKFHNHFITFSNRPRLVEIKGADIYEKVDYCRRYNEVAYTNIEAVFDLILYTAIEHHVPQKELPETLYIISDMEFDFCANDANLTNFQNAQKKYESSGYKLPAIVFWNVDSRNRQQPVTMNDKGVALVSGCSPKLFQMVVNGNTDPYEFMKSIILSDRYKKIQV